MWAVVVAGGSGARFGGPKQYADLGGRPVLAWAVDAARAACDAVVLVADPDRGDFGADAVVAGGASRPESVRRGLAAVPGGAAVVVVHDGARPLAGPDLFRAVLGALDGAAGVVPGVPVTDTLKRVDPAADGGPDVLGRVAATVDRKGLVAVQTPQAFDAAALRAAHTGGPEATDDAALVEAAGGVVRVVRGDPANLKITTPDDLVEAEALLRRREAGRA